VVPTPGDLRRKRIVLPRLSATEERSSLFVEDKDYEVPSRFTGKLDKLTFELGPEHLSAPQKKVKEKQERERD
jgi:hypothetical protein